MKYVIDVNDRNIVMLCISVSEWNGRLKNTLNKTKTICDIYNTVIYVYD